MPGNVDKYPGGNSFTSGNTPIPSSHVAAPGKLCPTDSPESVRTTRNHNKLSRDYFVGRSLANALESYNAKQIIDTAAVGGVHTIVHGLANNDPVAWRLAELPVLLEKKDGEIVASSVYTQKDGPLGFPIWIDLQAMSTFCGEVWLSQTAVDAAISLMCHPSPGVQILSSTWSTDSHQKKASEEYFSRHDIDTILLPMVSNYHWVAVKVSAKGGKIKTTLYDSLKRISPRLGVAASEIVSSVCNQLKFYQKLEQRPVNLGECSGQRDSSECGIHTISNLVSLAQKKEPNDSPLDCKALRQTYAEACCKT